MCPARKTRTLVGRKRRTTSMKMRGRNYAKGYDDLKGKSK